MKKLISDWGSGCSLALVNPFPMQLETVDYSEKDWTSYQLDRLTDDLETGRQRLTAYCQQLGFQLMGDGPYVIQALGELGPEFNDLDLPESIHIPPQIARKVERA